MITSKWIRPGEDISEALNIRKQVFQEELGWSQAMDQDAIDAYSYHLVLYHQDAPVAAGRISYGGVGKGCLGRICVLNKYRRQGIGDGLVKVLDYKASQLGMKQSLIETVKELEIFYMRIGFMKTGDTHNKYGMELISMQKECNDGTRENCAHQRPCQKS